MRLESDLVMSYRGIQWNDGGCEQKRVRVCIRYVTISLSKVLRPHLEVQGPVAWGLEDCPPCLRHSFDHFTQWIPFAAPI